MPIASFICAMETSDNLAAHTVTSVAEPVDLPRVRLLDSTGLASVMASSRPALIRFDPPDRFCTHCKAMAVLWEEQIGRRWPRATFRVNCSTHARICDDRGVAHGVREQSPEFASAYAQPDFQAWTGKGGWLRYTGRITDTAALISFCKQVVEPVRSRIDTRSTHKHSRPPLAEVKASVTLSDRTSSAVRTIEDNLLPITSAAEFALLRVDPLGCALPPRGEACGGLDRLWEVAAKQVKPRGGTWYLSCDQQPAVCESQACTVYYQ